MRRLPAALLIAVLAWASSSLWLGASAAPLQHRAEAEAVAVHGFYDHENLVPVPLFNLSVPYASASFEPGPSSEALGSFLWEREAANLNNIMCALSGNQFCQLPPYPFQAHATHPSSGEESDPPTLTIDEEGAPLRVHAAHEDAAADARGAGAEASVKRLAAIPMSGAQSRNASDLAAALTLVTGRQQDASGWLVAIRSAGADAEVAEGGSSIRSEGRSILRGLGLLGGLVTVDEVRGRATATTEGKGSGEAAAKAAGVRVGDLRARIGPKGVTIVDRTIGGEEAAQLSEAVNAALADAGLRIRPGDERVRKGETVRAEAFALAIEFRRQVLPDEFPEGTTGDDVVRIPLGWARASAAATEVAGAADVPAAVDVAPAVPADLGPPPEVGGVEAPAGVPEAAPAPAPAEAPAAYPVALAIPAPALASVIAVALLGLAGLVWLKIAEVLAE